MANEVFLPIATGRVAASTTSARIALPASASHLRVVNPTAAIVWVQPTDSSGVAVIPAAGASGTGWPVAPTSTESFRLDPSQRATQTHIAVILSAGTGDVYVTAGEGA